MGKTTVDRLGLTYLLLALLLAKLFTPEPRMLALRTGTSGWLVAFLAGPVALLWYGLLYALLRRYPGQSLGEISKRVLGGPVGKLACALYSAYFVYLSGVTLRNLIGGFKLAILPQTPVSALILLILGGALYASYKGFEALARMAAYLMPIMLALALLIAVGTIQVLDFRQLMPLFGHGVVPTLLGMLTDSALYGEIVALGVLAHLVKPKDLNQIGLTAILWAIGGLTLTMALLGAAFPYPAISRLAYPVLELTRMIEISEFLTRIESLFVILWFFVSGFKLALVLSAGALLYSQAAGLHEYRPLLPAVTLIAYTIAFLPANLIVSTSVQSYILPVWTLPISFGLPAATLAIAAIRGKRGAASDQVGNAG